MYGARHAKCDIAIEAIEVEAAASPLARVLRHGTTSRHFDVVAVYSATTRRIAGT